MPKFAVVAIEEIDRGGLRASPGDILDVSPVQFAMLQYRRLARLAQAADYVTAVVAPEAVPIQPDPESPPKTRRRRAYRTRQMKADR